MTIKKLPVATISCFLSASALAGSMGAIGGGPFVATLSAGPAWERAGETQTLYLQSDIFKTYAAQKSSHSLAIGELFIGAAHQLNSRLQGQLGFAVATASRAKLEGDIYEDADPDFNNFFYTYRVRHTHVAVKGKLLADMGYRIQPYLAGSLGLGWNRAYDFTITPKIPEEVPAPPFSNNTINAFSYTIGAGVEMPLSHHWHVGVGYELADWGKSELAPAQGQTIGSGPRLDHLYTQQLQFSLTYLA